LARSLFGASAAADVTSILPFEAPVLRWCLLFASVYLCIRALLQIRRGGRRDLSEEARIAAADRAGARFQAIAQYFGPAMLVLAILLPFLPNLLRFLPFGRGQALSVGILVMTYIMLGWGLNIVVGLAGLLDLGYVAFYAVGAYTYAILATTPELEWSFWVCL